MSQETSSTRSLRDAERAERRSELSPAFDSESMLKDKCCGAWETLLEER